MGNIYSQSGKSGVIDRPIQEWKRSTSDYKRLASFKFAQEDFGRALVAFNEKNGPLEEAPFDAVGFNTVLVPKDAAEIWSEWLHERGIAFDTRRVLESRELPADEIADLRKQNYRPAP